MKGPPEQAPDLGLGGKVAPRPIITPDWRKIPGKPHHYEHTRTGERKFAPPVPDAPFKPDPILDWYRKHGAI